MPVSIVQGGTNPPLGLPRHDSVLLLLDHIRVLLLQRLEGPGGLGTQQPLVAADGDVPFPPVQPREEGRAVVIGDAAQRARDLSAQHYAGYVRGGPTVPLVVVEGCGDGVGEVAWVGGAGGGEERWPGAKVERGARVPRGRDGHVGVFGLGGVEQSEDDGGGDGVDETLRKFNCSCINCTEFDGVDLAEKGGGREGGGKGGEGGRGGGERGGGGRGGGERGGGERGGGERGGGERGGGERGGGERGGGERGGGERGGERGGES